MTNMQDTFKTKNDAFTGKYADFNRQMEKYDRLDEIMQTCKGKIKDTDPIIDATYSLRNSIPEGFNFLYDTMHDGNGAGYGIFVPARVWGDKMKPYMIAIKMNDDELKLLCKAHKYCMRGIKSVKETLGLPVNYESLHDRRKHKCAKEVIGIYEKYLDKNVSYDVEKYSLKKEMKIDKSRELKFDTTLYINPLEGESEEQTVARLTKILEDNGISIPDGTLDPNHYEMRDL